MPPESGARQDVIRVLIVDDHAVVREGIRHVLSSDSDFEVVGEAAGGEAAVTLAESLMPDVVILDLSMPDLPGLEAARRIRALLPGTAILVLSIHDHQEYVLRSIEAGTQGYLRKDSSPRELRNAIERAVVLCPGGMIELTATRLPPTFWTMSAKTVVVVTTKRASGPGATAAELAALHRRIREHVAARLEAKQAEGVIAMKADAEAIVTILLSLADGLALRMLADPEHDWGPTLAAAMPAARALLV